MHRLSLLLLLLTACPSDSAAPPTATDVFWTAFLDQRYDQLPDVTAGLAAESAAHPDDPWTAELHAIALIWRFSEAARDPSFDRRTLPTLAATAEASLRRAADLLPTDPLILGRLGSLELGIGAALHDPTKLAAGRAHLDDSVRQYPQFALFNRARLIFDLPPNDPSSPDRLSDFWLKLDACANEPVDRASFDLTPYLPLATSTGADRVCWNTPHTPHGVEGFFLYMGDALLKLSDPTTAKHIYANARLSPAYATWPFQSDLDARIANADDWSARLSDADPSNDPPLITASPIACASCHAR